MKSDILPRIAAKIIPIVMAYGPDDALYLTFDDGPDPVITPRLLRELSDLNVKVTFFLSGSQVEQYPAIVKEIASTGHTIGTHGYTHKAMVLVSSSAVRQDLELSVKTIQDACGFTPTLFRPPYGRFNLSVLKIAEDLNMKLVLWSFSPPDYRNLTSDQITTGILSSCGNRDIILLHDRGNRAEYTLAAIQPIVQGIRDKGLEFAAL